MKAKYPVEAFALAIVLLTATLQDALVAGCLVFLAAAAGTVVKLATGKSEEKNMVGGIVAAIVGAAAFYVAFAVVLGVEATWQTIVGYAAIGILAGKFVYEDVDANNVSALNKECITAFIMVVVIGAVRELWGAGSLLGKTVIEGAFIASSMQSIMLGLIFAGLGIGFTNTIVKKESPLESLWIVIPAAVISMPATISNVPDALNIVIGAAIAAVLILSLRERLIYSIAKKPFRSIPVELISAGVVFMVMTIL